MKPSRGGHSRTGSQLRVDRLQKSGNGQGAGMVTLRDWELLPKSHTSLYPALQEPQPRLRVPLEISPRFLLKKDKTQRPAETLTAREKMVVARVAQGLSNAEIAGELKISKQTVKNHLRAVFEKVGVWSRLELAAWLFDHDCKLCPLRAFSPPHDREGVSAVRPLRF